MLVCKSSVSNAVGAAVSSYNAECDFGLGLDDEFEIAGMDALEAFVDGELDPMSYASVAAVVYSDAAASARVTELREQNVRLRQAFAEVLDEPVPPAMQMLVNSYAYEWRRAS